MNSKVAAVLPIGAALSPFTNFLFADAFQLQKSYPKLFYIKTCRRTCKERLQLCPKPNLRQIVTCDNSATEVNQPFSSLNREDEQAIGEKNLLLSSNLNIFTSAVLQISYDGLAYNGWTASNALREQDDLENMPPLVPYLKESMARPSTRRRRKLNRQHGINTRKVRTVSSVVQAALSKVYGERPEVKVEGCSRTDRGVSALCLVAHVFCPKKEFIQPIIPLSPYDERFEKLPFDGDLVKLIYVLNRMMPFDVRIVDASPMPNSTAPFHPSKSVASKTYTYRFALPRNIYDPMSWRHIWHMDFPSSPTDYFDHDKAKEACNLLIGKHDFSAFRAAYRGSERKDEKERNNYCTLISLSIKPSCESIYGNLESASSPQSIRANHELLPPEIFVVVLEGDRFLYKMCRMIVGALISVGYGKLSVDEISTALDQGHWNGEQVETDQKGTLGKFHCAPAQGLALVNVKYEHDIIFNWVKVGDQE